KTECANLHFAIIGDGETRPEIEALLKERNLPYNYFPENKNLQKFLLTSWQTRMDEVYAGLDIVCLTSLNEGTPISVIEAQAAARPVVSTAVGAVADTMLHNVSGYLVENFDADQFASYVLELIKNPSLRNTMGNAGREFVN